MKPTREDLEARWKILWARGRELDERQERLLSSMGTVENAIGKRALDQLQQDRDQHERDLLELKRQMREHGGFE
ncbi:MAG: hypothetical protein KC800_31340 [Candidatus Eremiobacteraeota bacterium]|nr:hypothetical protein [Candidatus Eremiobacteraeota bacterium]